MSDSLQPHGLPTRLLCPRNSPGKNTGVGCHSLLQGIFPTLVNSLLWTTREAKKFLKISFKDLFVRTSNTCSSEIIPLRIIMKLVLSILVSLIHQFWQRCSVSISSIVDRRGEVLFQANSSFPNTLLLFKFKYLRKHPAMWEVL